MQGHDRPEDLLGSGAAVGGQAADHCRAKECASIEGRSEFWPHTAGKHLAAFFLGESDVALDLVSVVGRDEGTEVGLRIRWIAHHHLGYRCDIAGLEGFIDAALYEQA